MKRRSIVEAIKEALKRIGKPSVVADIYSRIIEDDLYRFKATNPQHIVRTQLRRACINLDFPTARKTKHFVFLNNGEYWIKDEPHSSIKKEISQKDKTSSTYNEIKAIHKKYISDFKNSMLKQIGDVDPQQFEVFCKELLAVYGFKNVQVTQHSKDGGIDGFGELKIGLVFMKVAFECKRWKKTVGRPKVSQFRGDIQGKYQQGIFFTTSRFSKGAKDFSFRPGAVPIILLDGNSIVDLMIEKNFGVEYEEMPIYSNALDLVLDKNK